jgi:hypothetical protein
MWKKYPAIAKTLEVQDKDDGVFWIEYEDFFNAFNECYICHMFDDNKMKQVIYGDMFWEETDGGCPLNGRFVVNVFILPLTVI